MNYTTYISLLENAKESLETNGIAVIPNILKLDEVQQMQAGMWNILEDVTKRFDTPIDRNDDKTWAEMFKLYPLHSMMLQNFGIGHYQDVWNVRQNSNICKAFSTIWNSTPEEMLTSFDAISIHMPHEVTGKGYYKGNDWLHTDQSYTRSNLECIQGFVTAYDIREGDATLTILSKSHKYHEKVGKKFNITSKKNWHKLTQEQIDFYIGEGCKRECIMAPAGSLVLWDSRLIHAGQEPLKDRVQPNFRFVVYVCQLPKSHCDSKNLIKKQQAFNDLRLTSHWPNKVKLFPKFPNTYGGPMPIVDPIPLPILTNLGKSLAGI